ncbi:unnamed protein product [Mytilus coruscus]|uniref:Uncharacterized protein n=1 Tax=Mytilus coruscus TaxID=42192 RepID=A0A6J8A1U0_MYTCO|nr:unnamed protein product [Mytilus coruscus]
MTKWISNSPLVIKSIPEEERSKEVKQWSLEDDLPVERALELSAKEKIATRRSILSITSSVYDPLGIISPYVLNAKSILQGLCRQGFSWDKELTGTDLKKWNDWLDQLSDLENVRIDRCYKPKNFGKVVSSQLHCFSDASEIGYEWYFIYALLMMKE